MTKVVGRAVALVAALAFFGCSAGMSVEEEGSTNTIDGTGGVEFDLELPNGESISTINVHLSCSGIEQDHVLDVVNGEVVAAFGGLAPGSCTVTMSAQTPDGTDCLGEETFTVVADQTTQVTVTLMCQGVNNSPSGTARIATDFETKVCTVDRIRKIYAVPANILLGESTTIEVETWPGTLVTALNPATYSYETVNDATHLGEGTLSSSLSCAASSSSCSDFMCTGIGASTDIDPDTGLPVAGVWIEVTVEDDDCYDTERVWVECLQSSTCGDGVAEGVEECDGTDGVTLPSECGPAGAADECEIRECGDGVLNTAAEECDGTDGVGANQSCDTSCNLVDEAFCGDDIVNDGDDLPGVEECDGASTPVGQTCSATCEIVPVCGNGIQEDGEECDGTDGVVSPNTCFPAGHAEECTISEFVAPNVCLDCIEANPDIAADVATCEATPTCNAVLTCITASGCYYPNPHECYCGAGADAEACEGPSFTPTGDCWQEMRDAALAAGLTSSNADVLSYTGGALPYIDYGVTQVCIAECQF